ncbi:hypothetical protein M9H77_13300 [Catharanthus roseus]|uniref:Uncharacterized protein n=1 Tax=Catharanthus roseus TaxID=4058 RepID=A0ACC0BK44_CATRO|nr:hypothetical protein M9H77_13300 [Catharanthus roseus]
MGATIPARIPPGSIDHKKVFLFPPYVMLRYVHRRGNRNASCSAGVAWSKSVAGARLGIFPTPWYDTLRSSRPPTRTWRPFSLLSTIVLCMLDFGCRAIGRSKLWQDQSPGKQPSSKKNCVMPPDPYRAKELPGDP